MVGVNHTTGKGQSDGQSADHFVVIVAKGYDDVLKQVYYIFYEVGTKYEEKGTSSQNKLYITPDYTIRGSNYAGTRKFTVTDVRKN
ncbi:MAG: hypothetical protein HYR91_04085 [Flavobacteriia bacterium]|nr:hypothetical protein [Flavobacteriia bacterium]